MLLMLTSCVVVLSMNWTHSWMSSFTVFGISCFPFFFQSVSSDRILFGKYLACRMILRAWFNLPIVDSSCYVPINSCRKIRFNSIIHSVAFSPGRKIRKSLVSTSHPRIIFLSLSFPSPSSLRRLVGSPRGAGRRDRRAGTECELQVERRWYPFGPSRSCPT